MYFYYNIKLFIQEINIYSDLYLENIDNLFYYEDELTIISNIKHSREFNLFTIILLCLQLF